MATELEPPSRSEHHRHHRSHHRSHHHRSHHRSHRHHRDHDERDDHDDSRRHRDSRPSKTIAKTKHHSRRTSKVGHTTAKHDNSSHHQQHASSKRRSSSHHRRSRKQSSSRRSPPDTGTETYVEEERRRRHRRTHSGRGPSSSIGPGVLEPVVIIMIALLAISSAVLLSVGIWLLATRNGWPAGLNNTGSRTWTRFISYGTACIIVSILFIPIIVLSALAAVARSGASARLRRLMLTFFTSFAVVALILMSATGLLFAVNGPVFVTEVIRTAWINTVKDGSNFNDACDIQNKYKCEGWEDNDCLKCRPTQSGVYDTPYGNCTNLQKEICPRCWAFDRSAKTTQRMPVFAADRLFAADWRNAATEMGALTDTGTTAEGQGGEWWRKLPRSARKLLRRRAAHQRTNVRGCKRYIIRRHRQFFIPMVVYTIFLTLVLILLSWKACIDSSGR